ncbi:hypothetical protein CerSpe_170280 [Prunus speciosa]
MNKLKIRFAFSHVLAMSSRGQSGGLALLWNNDTELFIKSFSDHFIDAEVGSIGVAGRWRLTGFYGFPATADRDKSWVLLSQLGLHNHLPWLCVGDFTELLFAHEKEGGLPRSDRQMEGFCEVVDLCAFQDLGFSGYKFTWKRNYAGEVIRERLDRALAISLFRMFCILTLVRQIICPSSWLSSLSRCVVVRPESGFVLRRCG